MFVVQIIILFFSYRTMREQNSSYYYEKTQSISSSFYSQISSFRTIALKFSNTNGTSIKKFANADLDAPEKVALGVSEELSHYSFSVPLAHSVGIYYKNQEVFLNESFYYRLENFCSNFPMAIPQYIKKFIPYLRNPSRANTKWFRRFLLVKLLRQRCAITR